MWTSWPAVTERSGMTRLHGLEHFADLPGVGAGIGAELCVSVLAVADRLDDASSALRNRRSDRRNRPPTWTSTVVLAEWPPGLLPGRRNGASASLSVPRRCRRGGSRFGLGQLRLGHELLDLCDVEFLSVLLAEDSAQELDHADCDVASPGRRLRALVLRCRSDCYRRRA